MTFTASPAVRGTTPLLLGIVGPGGSGKTFSALRLARGMVRVFGGHVTMIDTENGRGLHYADEFAYQHIPFDPPFSPARYTEAFECAVADHASVIIIDSGSHEWEGEGGVLDLQEEEIKRLTRGDDDKRDRMKFASWARPKAEHGRFRQTIVRASVTTIICFRAKEKVELKAPQLGGKKEMVDLGWRPITADDLTYELMLRCLLPPGSDGKPRWTPEQKGEREVFKLPQQFRDLFPDDTVQLTENLGERMARWAVGTCSDAQVEAIVSQYASCADVARLAELEAQRKDIWQRTTKAQKAALKAAADAATARDKS
jgi:hypothetical protein